MTLISGCFTLAVLLFVLSLPVAATGVGKFLRRWALFFLVAALAPSVVFSLFCSSHSTAGTTGEGPSTLSEIVGVALVSAIAYGILKVRARFLRPQRDAWSEYVGQRSAGKRVVDDRERTKSDDGVGF